jgi:hypothetical protein
MALFVGKIATSINTRGLEDLFSPHGKIIRLDHRGNHAFITYDQMNAAESAMKDLKNKEVDGQK